MVMFLSPSQYRSSSQSVDDLTEHLRSIEGSDISDTGYQRIAEYLHKTSGELMFVENFIKDIFYSKDRTKVVDGYGESSLLLGGTEKFAFRIVKWTTRQNIVAPDLDREGLVYDLVHNHDFHLITKGIHGDGYETDIYRCKPGEIVGAYDESVDIQYQGRLKLIDQSVIWYEQYSDIHAQYPPESFSISFNIIPRERNLRYGQFVFDRSTGRIKEFTRNGASRTLSLLTLLCDFDRSDAARDIAVDLGETTTNLWLKTAVAHLISDRWNSDKAELWDKFEIPVDFVRPDQFTSDRFGAHRIR